MKSRLSNSNSNSSVEAHTFRIRLVGLTNIGLLDQWGAVKCSPVLDFIYLSIYWRNSKPRGHWCIARGTCLHSTLEIGFARTSFVRCQKEPGAPGELYCKACLCMIQALLRCIFLQVLWIKRWHKHSKRLGGSSLIEIDKKNPHRLQSQGILRYPQTPFRKLCGTLRTILGDRILLSVSHYAPMIMQMYIYWFIRTVPHM